MESPSQSLAQASQLKKNRKRSRKSGRPSNVGQGDNAVDIKSPSTPVNRFAAHRNVDAFSPFSFRSSEDSPKPSQSSSPSIILFSGPAERRFERVHGDSFPQDVEVLKSLARSKFKLAPAAPVEMSFVNPDGVVCVLDDRDDLEALAAHAALSQKLTVNVISSDTHAPNPHPASTQQVKPLTNGAGLKEPPSSKAASGKRKRSDDTHPQAHSATAGAPLATGTPSSPSTPLAKKLKQPHPKKLAGSISSSDTGAVPPDALFAEPNVSASTSAVLPTTARAPIEAEPSQILDAEKARPFSQATSNGLGEQLQPSSETPKRGRAGRPRKVVATHPAPDVVLVGSNPTAQSISGQQNHLAPTAAEPLVITPPAQASLIPQTEAMSQAEPPTQRSSQTVKSNGITATGKLRGRPPKNAMVGPSFTAEAAEPSTEGSPLASHATASGQPTGDTEAATPAAKKSARATKTVKASATAATHPTEPSLGIDEPASVTTSTTDSQEMPLVEQPSTAIAATTSQLPVDLDKVAAPPTRRGARALKADETPKETPMVPAAEQDPPVAPTSAAREGARTMEKVNRTKDMGAALTAGPPTATEPATEVQAPPEDKSSHISTEATSQQPTDFSEVSLAPTKKASRATKASKVSKQGGAAAAATLSDDPASGVHGASSTDLQQSNATGQLTQPSQASMQSPTPVSNIARLASDSVVSAASDTAVVAEPSSSALSPDQPLQDGDATGNAPAFKRSTAAAKPRASKAKEKKANEPAPNTCVVCGALPDHEKEVCPVWQGGSQAILDLLAMMRHKGSKSKKEKESSKILYHWLAEQFGAGQGDAAPPGQDSTKASQETVTPTAFQPQNETNGLLIQPASPAREAVQIVPPEQREVGQAVTAARSNGTATATKAATSPTAVSKRRPVANKGTAVDSESQAQLPPPSGVEALADATQTTTSASTKKPATKIKRATSKNAAAAATATAAEPISSPSDPRIALLPSSPLQSSISPPHDVSSRLRAPSESSEAELATSPMLSAAPRGNDDMDVDPLPSQSELVASNSTAQQLEERKRRMKMADKGARASSSSKRTKRGLVSNSTRSRSRSASVTSSDSSNNGDSSGSDLGSDTDNEMARTATKARQGTTKTPSAKGVPRNAQSTTTTRSRRGVQSAANNAASSSDSGTDSLPSDFDSQTDSDSGSGSEPGPQPSSGKAGSPSSLRAGSFGSTASTTQTARRAPDNPFLRGLNSLRPGQKNGGSTNQKPVPFTRLSELKPATLRQNLSQPGSPLSTGGSTPLSASGQTCFFPDSSAPPNGSKIPKQGESDDDSDSDSDSSTDSSDDEAPNKGRGSGKKAVPTSKLAGAAAPTAPSTKKRKGVFSFFT